MNLAVVLLAFQGALSADELGERFKLALRPATRADDPFLERLRVDLRRATPGLDVRWLGATERLAADETRSCVAFVQLGVARATLEGAGDSSECAVGDLFLLRPGQVLCLDSPLRLLAFDLPQVLGDELPWIVRPDWDPRITDTPGGCADDVDAYRRILLTWDPANGPYVHRGLNAHRMRVTDSFTHYHPLEGGFDELYLVQGAEPGAGLWIGEDATVFEDPELARVAPERPLLRFLPLERGDLVYLPRGVVHRGVGGVLAQVIALPGFVPGMEHGVDAGIRRLNQRLGLELPCH